MNHQVESVDAGGLPLSHLHRRLLQVHLLHPRRLRQRPLPLHRRRLHLRTGKGESIRTRRNI